MAQPGPTTENTHQAPPAPAAATPGLVRARPVLAAYSAIALAPKAIQVLHATSAAFNALLPPFTHFLLVGGLQWARHVGERGIRTWRKPEFDCLAAAVRHARRLWMLAAAVWVPIVGVDVVRFLV
ncbi:hypothetical protein LTR36_002338 [Oleoguttula mirabilis]|uniref:Uncharacterized protein n=1 Tax=Oleoguttula mirabilis TaxID=1507867 RepID=A0AAV9JLH2_9PEZI|nr:hypothetical protein LTR36_002338 [Oleoguttula mirabilis]